MSDPEHEIVEQKVRRAVGISALRKIGAIVARERQADKDRTRVLRWFICYGCDIAGRGAVAGVCDRLDLRR